MSERVKCLVCDVTDEDLLGVRGAWQMSIPAFCPACIEDLKEMLTDFSQRKQERLAQEGMTTTGRIA